MSCAWKEARRFALALIFATFGILLSACDSTTAPEFELRDPDSIQSPAVVNEAGETDTAVPTKKRTGGGRATDLYDGFAR